MFAIRYSTVSVGQKEKSIRNRKEIPVGRKSEITPDNGIEKGARDQEKGGLENSSLERCLDQWQQAREVFEKVLGEVDCDDQGQDGIIPRDVGEVGKHERDHHEWQGVNHLLP